LMRSVYCLAFTFVVIFEPHYLMSEVGKRIHQLYLVHIFVDNLTQAVESVTVRDG
jgi:hypothetical protein